MRDFQPMTKDGEPREQPLLGPVSQPDGDDGFTNEVPARAPTYDELAKQAVEGFRRWLDFRFSTTPRPGHYHYSFNLRVEADGTYVVSNESLSACGARV